MHQSALTIGAALSNYYLDKTVLLPKTSVTKPHTGIPENITRAGSYFCRTALNRDRFGPKYRDAGWLASR
jgi:hypothetical protein